MNYEVSNTDYLFIITHFSEWDIFEAGEHFLKGHVFSC